MVAVVVYHVVCKAVFIARVSASQYNVFVAAGVSFS